jgi:alditol oxidase
VAERNWAGNIAFAGRLERPSTLAELQEVVAGSPRVRALGTRHSFSDVADTDGVLVSVAGLPRVIEPDTARGIVRVSAGTPYGAVAAALQRAGLALHNLGSLPHISVGGAVATGTHGSGNGNGILATAVSRIEYVTASGGVRSIAGGEPGFDGSVVALGLLGIATTIDLRVEPSYDIRQDAFGGLSWAAFLADPEAVFGSAYSTSVFTDFAGERVGTLWLKTRGTAGSVLEAPAAVLDATPLDEAQPDDNTTLRGGVPGPWSERLAHFRGDTEPSNSGDELQSEYFVDRAQASAALDRIRALAPRIAPHLLIGELRTSASDALWLSGSSGRETLGIHFTWKNEPAAVAALLPEVEAALAPFDARPHWGKLFGPAIVDRLPELFPRLTDFRALRAAADPDGRFLNPYAHRVGLA